MFVCLFLALHVWYNLWVRKIILAFFVSIYSLHLYEYRISVIQKVTANQSPNMGVDIALHFEPWNDQKKIFVLAIHPWQSITVFIVKTHKECHVDVAVWDITLIETSQILIGSLIKLASSAREICSNPCNHEHQSYNLRAWLIQCYVQKQSVGGGPPCPFRDGFIPWFSHDAACWPHRTCHFLCCSWCTAEMRMLRKLKWSRQHVTIDFIVFSTFDYVVYFTKVCKFR